MLPAPPDSIPLEDKRSVTQQLVRSRATIHEINTVRRHLSKLKGGMLVERCWASMILSFIISDVPDNTLQDIASGPTAPDPTTFRDAVGVLRKYGLWDSTPRSVRLHLELGLKGKIPETPKPSNPIFRRVHNFIIADNGTACKAARDALEARQTHTRILTSSADMEAKSMGSLLGSIAKDKRRFARPVSGRSAIILGGETTVEVRGRGVGGRNQETVLSAVERIADLDGVAIAAFGTDGIDGSSAAAGAIADGNTSRRASKKYLEPAAFLASNNSYHFFKRLNDNIFTGRTGTNVGDLYLLVCTK
jgi:glycerate-2-kinase